jgi:hypothetical protein
MNSTSHDGDIGQNKRRPITEIRIQISAIGVFKVVSRDDSRSRTVSRESTVLKSHSCGVALVHVRDSDG